MVSVCDDSRVFHLVVPGDSRIDGAGYAQHPGYNGHERGFDQKHGAQQYAGVPQYQQGPPMHEHQQSAIGEGSDTGDYLGISWTIKHRSSNSTISINLPSQGDTISSKAGAMVHMSSSIRMEGKVNFSMKKLFTGSQMIDVTYIGPSTVTLAPLMMGDIVTIPIDTAPPQKGRVSKNDAWSGWNIGKHCFLAASAGVERVTEAQGLKNAFFSGNDLWIYRLVGKGVAWITSFGAIEAIQVRRTASSFPLCHPLRSWYAPSQKC